MLKITYVKYECTNCGEVDHDKLFPHEIAVPTYNCWSCHQKGTMQIVDLNAPPPKRI